MGEPALTDPRSVEWRRWVYAALIAYAIGFLLFPPRVLLVTDEFNYVGQALAFARGASTVPGAEPLLPANPLPAMSNYPPGTSLLQAPLVALFGWRGAPALSVAALIIATLVTMRWLRDLRYNEGFAILVPAYAGTLLFARLAMSDVPSAAIVAVTLWLTWRAERRWPWAVSAGLMAGISILFRETNAVLLAPIVIAAMLRDRRTFVLVSAGVLAGAVARLWISHEMFGAPFYVRDSGFGFSTAAAVRNLPVLAALLLVAVPLGALLPWLYRGPHRAALLTAISLHVGVFLFYDYSAHQESGLVRGVMLTSRFFVPAMPVFALLAADVYPRLLAGLRGNAVVSHHATRGALALVVLVAFAIHPAVHRAEEDPIAIVTAIQTHTAAATPIVTNHHATLKYLSPIYGERRLIFRSYATEDDVVQLAARHGRLSLVFLDRGDSEAFRRDAGRNAELLDALHRRCRVAALHDSRHGSGVRLRIFDAGECRS